MKKSLLVIGAGAVALAASAFAGHHEGEKMDGDKAAKHAEHMAKMEAKMAEKFAAADTDGSGTVSKDEFMAARMAEAEAEWADGADYLGDDGEASLEEVMAYNKAKMEAKKAKHKAMKEGKKDGE
ncbi:MAG: hypothetical protein HKN14_12680 [Marinicaulis sp.]|nr:hypothetical protein [Marinicaulis sp.]NNE41760.1 hypothetical protein [Marinicaulis sp.]NNL89979.1 hypothetical protein [Marinicaulis sp.]